MFAHSLAWLLAGAHTVALTAPAELPLLHRDGDPRPAVSGIANERAYDVVVDPFGPSRIGRLAAIRLGLDDERDDLVFDLTLGPLALDGLRAEVVDGEDLVLGLAALPELVSHLDPVTGTVHLLRASDRDQLAPFPIALPRHDGHRSWPSGPLAGAPIDLAATATVGPVDARWSAGRYEAWILGADPRFPFPVRHADEGVLGADALATVAVRCAPAAEACAFDPVDQHWAHDAEQVGARRAEALDEVEEKAALWTVPEGPDPAVSVPEGDPGSSWEASRWLDLSDAAWRAGKAPRALYAAAVATDAGRDRCQPWMVLGERTLRVGAGLDRADGKPAADPVPFLERAWRQLRLHEDGAQGYTLSQPEACRAAAALLDEARLRSPDEAGELLTPLGRAVRHLHRGELRRADAALREAFADGTPATPERLAVHAVVQHRLGRDLPAVAAVERLAADPDADTLWVGELAVAVVGPERLRALATGPAWRTVADRHQGHERATQVLSLSDSTDDGPTLAAEVALRLARQPGDPTGWALARWLGNEAPSGPPSLDDAVIASWLGDDEPLRGWPLHALVLDVVAVDPPLAKPVLPADRSPAGTPAEPPRVESAPPPEPVMIPALVSMAFAFDHDHAAFATFLDGAVTDEGVDYAALAGRENTLDAYLKEVAEVDASGFDKAQQLALYVNAYNAYTLKTMLDTGAASIMEIDGGKVWDARTFPVAGASLTLNQMEHEHARKLADGRVHAVVNCASKGCPPLPPVPLKGSGIDAQLDAAARRWAATNAYRLSGDTVALSMIFDWYGDDFVGVKAERDLPKVDGKAEQALWFLAPYVDDATKTKLLSGTLTATWAEYDWSRNAL